MECRYKTQNICPTEIKFTLEDDIVKNVEFLGGGCLGNLQALSKLIDGMTVDEIKEKIGNITCGIKETSCAGELVKAIETASRKSKQRV